MTTDIIDLLAGISPGDALDAVRDQRPQARENAQRSFEALLEPAEPGTFPLAERYAVAAFVARLHGFDAAADFYDDLLADEAPELATGVAAAAALVAAANAGDGDAAFLFSSDEEANDPRCIAAFIARTAWFTFLPIAETSLVSASISPASGGSMW